MSKRTKGGKGNPYTWQEALERCHNNPLPPGTHYRNGDGDVCRITPYPLESTTGERGSGYLDNDEVIGRQCSDGKLRPKPGWEPISPPNTELWSRAREQNPRPQSDALARRYAMDIINGDFMENPADCIVFDTASGMLNGGHRVQAVGLAQKSIWALVVRGVDAKDRKKIARIDRGRSRPQYLNMTKLFKQCASEEDAKIWTQVSKQFLRGHAIKDGTVRTDAELERQIGEDIKAYVWLSKTLGACNQELVDMLQCKPKTRPHRTGKAVTHPTILAAFLRARIYYKSAEDLQRLSKMLIGFVTGKLTAQRDTAAIVLREKLINEGFPEGIVLEDRIHAYNFTERAIEAFIAGQSISSLVRKKLKNVDEHFPLAREDTDDDADAAAVAG